MNSLLKSTVKRAMNKATAGHIFAKELRYNSKDKALSIVFFDSMAAYRKVNPLPKGKKSINEFNLWFCNSESQTKIHESVMAKIVLRMCVRLLFYDFIEKVYFEFPFRESNIKYTCEIDTNFCAALIDRTEREQKYNSDFLNQSKY